MFRVDLSLLHRCPLLSGVPLAELDAFFQRHPLRCFSVDRGKLIRMRGDPYTELLILLSGTVVAQISTLDGKILTVETMEAPDTLASSILFAEDNSLPVNVVAAVDCRLASIPRSNILQLCQSHEEVLIRLLRDMGGRTRFLAEKLRLSALSSLKQKLAVYLLENAQIAHQQVWRDGCPDPEQAPPVDPPPKGTLFRFRHQRKQLSEIFGVARPSLSRVLGEFVEAGVILVDEEEVQILQPARLASLAAGCE